MRVTQENLNKGLQIVSPAVAARSTLPVLSNILFASDNGKLKLSACDSAMSITTWIDADELNGDSVTLPAKKICTLASKFPSGEFVDVNIDSERARAVVKCKRSTTTLSGIISDEFPVLPDMSEVMFQASSKLFREAVDKVLMAAASDQSRPVLSGISIRFLNGKIVFSCADGFRLSVLESDVDSNLSIGVIIPADVISQVGKLSTQYDTVKLFVDDSHIVFELSTIDSKTIVTGQLIDGNFPDASGILNQNRDKSVTCNAQELAKAIELVMVTGQDNDYFLKVELCDSESERGLKLSSMSSESQSSNFVPCDVNGQLTLAIGGLYMLQALKRVSGDICLQFGEYNTSVRFDDNNWTHVIMPMVLRQ